jgi:hypothetical protein
MNNVLFRSCRNGFCKALLFAVLASTIPVNESIAMFGVTTAAPVPTENIGSPRHLQALSYYIPGSFAIAVHMENPQLEKVSILILDKHNQVVYRKNLGKTATYVSKLNVKNLPNGSYRIVVKSPNHTYTRAFSLQTHTKRTVTVANPNEMDVKQEAI